MTDEQTENESAAINEDGSADTIAAAIVLACLVTGFLLMVSGFDGF